MKIKIRVVGGDTYFETDGKEDTVYIDDMFLKEKIEVCWVSYIAETDTLLVTTQKVWPVARAYMGRIWIGFEDKDAWEWTEGVTA